MIRFNNAGKDYGDVHALQDVSFSISPGGIVGMLGPNGAGKTTAMRIMTGFLAPTRGEVFLDGDPFGPDSVDARRRIGYLPESAPLYNDMLAWDYLVYEARLHGIDPTERVPQVIREVGLGSHAHMPIRELSKGFRQRVGLAHALLHDPELLVLDEPTSGLDPNQILEVRALIRRIAATKTVILSTHIMQEVEALCDRVLVIHKGSIRYEGSIGDFTVGTGAGHQSLRLLVGGIDLSALRNILSGVPGFLEMNRSGTPLQLDAEAGAEAGAATALLPVRLVTTGETDARPEVFRLAVENGFVIYEMAREQTTLEDVFHELTQEERHD